MKIDVYDTYALSKKGHIVHFDVLVMTGTSQEKAHQYARSWLQSIGENPEGLDQSRCNYCHSENASPAIESAILQEGYYILQMEGCPNPV